MAKKNTLSSQRRSHSTLDKLPVSLKSAVDAMLVDNIIPDDYYQEIDGKPTYAQICEYCKFKGYTISESAMGRYGLRMRALSRLKKSGLIAREAMSGLNEENASETQKAAVELITAHAIEYLADNDGLNPNDMQKAAKAMRDCAGVAITADKYVRTQLTAKAAKAEKKIEKMAAKKNIDPETLKMIKEQIYGIIEN